MDDSEDREIALSSAIIADRADQVFFPAGEPRVIVARSISQAAQIAEAVCDDEILAISRIQGKVVLA